MGVALFESDTLLREVDVVATDGISVRYHWKRGKRGVSSSEGNEEGRTHRSHPYKPHRCPWPPDQTSLLILDRTLPRTSVCMLYVLSWKFNPSETWN
jgi:hypothetical protein